MNTSFVFRFTFILVGLILNVVLYVLVFNWTQGHDYWPWLAVGSVIFMISMLTPFGDTWLDLSIGSREPTRKERAQLEEAVNDLRASAKKHSIRFPEKLRLRVLTDPYPNGMAFGNNTVALTSGLLQSGTPDDVRGIMAHEVGHIVNRDTAFNLETLAAFGPLLLLGIICIRMAQWFVTIPFIGWIFALSVLGFGIVPLAACFIYRFFSFLLSFTDRGMEYAADAYAIHLTRNDSLLTFLEKLEDSEIGPSGQFLAAYQASHPPTALREDKARFILEQL